MHLSMGAEGALDQPVNRPLHTFSPENIKINTVYLNKFGRDASFHGRRRRP